MCFLVKTVYISHAYEKKKQKKRAQNVLRAGNKSIFSIINKNKSICSY